MIQALKKATGLGVFWSACVGLTWLGGLVYLHWLVHGESLDVNLLALEVAYHVGAIFLVVVQLAVILNSLYSTNVLEEKTYSPLIFAGAFVLVFPTDQILVLALANFFWMYFLGMLVRLDDHSGKRMNTFLFASLIFTTVAFIDPSAWWFLPIVLIGLRTFGYLDLNRLFAFLSFSVLTLFIYLGVQYAMGDVEDVLNVVQGWFHWRMNLGNLLENKLLLLLAVKSVFWLALAPQLFAAQPNSSIVQRRFYNFLFLLIAFGILLAILNTKNILNIFSFIGVPITLYIGLCLDGIRSKYWALAVVVFFYAALFSVHYYSLFGF